MAENGLALLVTGGAGFIGSHFVKMAVSNGYRVIILDKLTYAGNLSNLDGALLNSDGCQLVMGNICDLSLVQSLLSRYQIEGVINFAAESHVDRSIEKPAVFYETNVFGTLQLLQASLDYWKTLDAERQKRFRFIQISTDEVFGSLGPEGRFSEVSPYFPNSPYSASKAAADHLVRAWYHTYQLPTLITHCSNNYGPHQHSEKLIPTIIFKALQGESIPIYGDGSNIRDWIHVEDHCSGVLLALQKGNPGASYCLGGGAERNNLEVARLICSNLDEIVPLQGTSYSSQIRFVSDRPGHDWRYAIDDSEAQVKLGFRRSFTFESGLKKTVRWYLENRAQGIKPFEKRKSFEPISESYNEYDAGKI